MERRPARLDQILIGRWRKVAADECPDLREMWRYWLYTNSVMQEAVPRDAVELPEAKNQRNKARKVA
jgi:hypothetical protein